MECDQRANGLPGDLIDTPVAVNIFCAAHFFRQRTLDERVELALAANARAAEIHSFLLFERSVTSMEAARGEALNEVATALGRLGRISIHGPFPNALISRTASKRQQFGRAYRFAIEQAAHLQASCVVVHFSPWQVRTAEARSAGMALLRELGDFAAERGVLLGVENGGDSGGPADFVGLIAEIDHPAVGATVDTGHLTSWLSPEERAAADSAERYNSLLARLVGELHAQGRLHHLHLNDVHPLSFGDHYGPGFGMVDFERVFRNLCRNGYDGLLSIEMHRGSDRETGSITPGEFRRAVKHAQSCWVAARRTAQKAEQT